ncbi:hypothetical protein PtA15_15A304 [Puccinia triticina]|uniref:BZIP domain-containing protein n=1 Tax=Puccinia triticina TaxID=208348 RepID=A0ABY7D2U2_9BASI|nr:uncharacterized protein PtA15_15A304 [Puccinia triticina]WAQ91911.1 hypothetical protein PtA15_15A304 [Puccinia triticina]
MSTLRSGSPTPSASNSDHSLAKRKPDDGHNPKPAKISRPASIQELPFDPFSPHPGMSKEERKLARMIRNRTAAQASRDRKKEHVAELENRVRELEEQLRILSRPPPAMPCLRPPAAPSPSPETDKKIDPQLNRTADHHPSPTISPAQAEYLSKVRIHVLEEENSQLRSQLAYELKKAQLPPLSAPDEHRPQGSSPAIEIDQGMIEMILKDDEIDKSLHSPQLSMDWDSLLLDRPAPSPSSSPTTDRPTSKEHRDSSHDDDRFETMMTMAAMDDTRWNQGTWPSPSGSPSDPRPPTLAPTRPETPPPDQQPQAPAERALSALSPAAHPVPPAPHPRLVAREDSLQRNGGSAGRTARPDSSRRAPCVSPGWARLAGPTDLGGDGHHGLLLDLVLGGLGEQDEADGGPAPDERPSCPDPFLLHRHHPDQEDLFKLDDWGIFGFPIDPKHPRPPSASTLTHPPLSASPPSPGLLRMGLTTAPDTDPLRSNFAAHHSQLQALFETDK